MQEDIVDMDFINVDIGRFELGLPITCGTAMAIMDIVETGGTLSMITLQQRDFVDTNMCAGLGRITGRLEDNEGSIAYITTHPAARARNLPAMGRGTEADIEQKPTKGNTP